MSSNLFRVLFCGLVDIFPAGYNSDSCANNNNNNDNNNNLELQLATSYTDIDNGEKTSLPVTTRDSNDGNLLSASGQQRPKLAPLNTVQSSSASIKKRCSRLSRQGSQCSLKRISSSLSASPSPTSMNNENSKSYNTVANNNNNNNNNNSTKKITSVTRSDILSRQGSGSTSSRRSLSSKTIVLTNSPPNSFEQSTMRSSSASTRYDEYHKNSRLGGALVDPILESSCLTIDRTMSNLSNHTSESTYINFIIDSTPDLKLGF